jgi:WD40 repeat protein/DNA-binding SARP family transcriptional activator
MKFKILGPLEVVDGDGPIEISSPTQRALLAMLLLTPNSVISSDRLLDQVWDHEPPSGGLNTLRFHVSKLRDALQPDRASGEEGLVITKSPGYSLVTDPENVDAAQFELLVQEARRIVLSDPARASLLLNEALDLWRGPALADFIDAPFAETEIRRLEELRLNVLEDRIEADLALGRHTDVVAELKKLTSEHHYRERLWGHLMVALYRSDRQAEALRAYQELRKRLGDDLGLEPSSDIRTLEDRILLQDEELKTPGAVQPPGGQLRGYVLEDRLGEGAFGVVWRARQPAVGREVAIKVIKPELSNRPGFVRRFEAEARLVASLEHPHIVPVLDFWRDPDGAYLVMRLMPGGALNVASAEGLPPTKALPVLEQVSSALAFAHRRGLVHADLHPGNVLLDAEGNAFLADFGLAARLTGGTSTPPEGYTSPEHRSGRPLTAASDVFGMGTLAYRLLTGIDPPAGDLPSVTETRKELPAEIDPVLNRATAVDPEARFDTVEELLDDIQSAFGRSPSEPRIEARNPYKGLRAFEEVDTADFFGRTPLVQELLEALDRHRLVGVVGPSGSGKSSAVRAGLVPALRAGRLAGSDGWLITDMYPGEDPFTELAEALRRVSIHEPPELARQLANPVTLINSVRAALPPNAELVLIVDQFEELFTLCRDEDVRRRFMTALMTLVDDPLTKTRVIVTLRADFYAMPLQFQPFGDVLRSTVVSVTPPGLAELTEAVKRPSQQVGVDVDPELVTEIIHDVIEQPGGLPLMEYTLTQLFEQRAGQTLTLGEYFQNGGLVGALGSWPEQLYATLDKRTHDAVRQIWLRLVNVNESGQDTRRRVPLPELYELGIDEPTIDRVLKDYGAARLLTFDRDPETRLPTVEVAHEALLRRWERLSTWIDESREALILYRRFSDAFSDWQSADGDPAYLLRRGRLHQFEAWAENTDLALTEGERDFLRFSRVEADALATKRRRQRRLIGSILGALAVTAGIFGIVALVQRDRAAEQQQLAEEQALIAEQRATEADDQRRLAEQQTVIAEQEAAEADEQRAEADRQAGIAADSAEAAQTLTELRDAERATAQQGERFAQSRVLAASSVASLETDPELSVLLAIEAIEVTTVDGIVLPEAEAALHAALSANRLVAAIPSQFYARSVTFSPDGATLYIAGANESQIASSPLLEEPSILDIPIAFSAVAGPDDDLLVVGQQDGLLAVYDRASLDELAVNPDAEVPSALFHLEGHLNWLSDIAVSGDGNRVASISSWGGNAFVWDLSQRVALREFAMDCPSPSRVTCAGAIAISPDGSLVGFGSTVYSVATGRPVAEPSPEGAILKFLDGAEKVIVVEGTSVLIVDVDTGRVLDTLTAHTSEPTRVAVAPNGTRLATAGRDGLVHVWDLDPEGARLVMTLAGHEGPAWNVAFSPDGRYLASSGGLQDFGTADFSRGPPYTWQIRMWDVSDAGTHEWMVACSVASRAIFHPSDNGIIATTGSELAIWDPGTGERRSSIAIPDGADASVLALAPKGDLLVIGGTAPDATVGWLQLMQYPSGEVSRELIVPADGFVPADVAFSRDGLSIAAISHTEIRVWNTATGNVVFSHSNQAAAPGYAAVAFGPESRILVTVATAGENEFAPGGAVWNLESGDPDPSGHILQFARGERAAVAFNPDAPLLLTAGTGRPIISEAYTGMSLATLTAAAPYASAGVFSSDGSLIATGEADGAVRLWKANSGRLVMSLQGHESEVTAVAFSPDDRRLASVDVDGTMRVWALDIDDLLALARAQVTRDLTDAEYQSHLPATNPTIEEPFLPDDWLRTVPPGIDDAAWAAALTGGTWEQISASGLHGDIVAIDEEANLLLVHRDEMVLVDPVTGEGTAMAQPPLVENAFGEPVIPEIAAMAYHPDSDRIIVYTAEKGGVFAYETGSNTWIRILAVEELLSEEQLAADDWGIVNGPFGDYGQGMIHDAESDLIVLFGGASWGRIEDGHHVGLNHTWIYDPAADTWVLVEPEASPPGRVSPMMVYDAESDRVILFGGSPGFGTDDPLLGDTWAFDANTGTWSDMSPEISPPARSEAAMWYDPEADLVFLFGGAQGWLPWDTYGAEELWGYDYDSNTWTLFRVDPNPGYRNGSMVVYDSDTETAWLFGGDYFDAERRYRGYLSDTWAYRHTSSD